MKPNPLEPKFRTLLGYLNNEITLDDILTDVSVKMDISVEDLKRKARKREITEARAIFYCQAVSSAKNFSRYQIARFIGLKRCTVIHGIKNVQNIQSLNKKYHELYG